VAARGKKIGRRKTEDVSWLVFHAPAPGGAKGSEGRPVKLRRPSRRNPSEVGCGGGRDPSAARRCASARIPGAVFSDASTRPFAGGAARFFRVAPRAAPCFGDKQRGTLVGWALTWKRGFQRRRRHRPQVIFSAAATVQLQARREEEQDGSGELKRTYRADTREEEWKIRPGTTGYCFATRRQDRGAPLTPNRSMTTTGGLWRIRC